MDRMEQLAALAAKPLGERFEERCGQVLSEAAAQKEPLMQGLAAALDTAMTQARALQMSGRKGPIAFISFSILHSNILLDRNGLRVDIYDEGFWVDDAEASSDWDLAWLFRWMDEDLNAAAKNIRQSVSRVQEYELLELAKAYSLNYYALATLLLTSMLPATVERVPMLETKRAPMIQITAGQYMENQPCIFEWRLPE